MFACPLSKCLSASPKEIRAPISARFYSMCRRALAFGAAVVFLSANSSAFARADALVALGSLGENPSLEIDSRGRAFLTYPASDASGAELYPVYTTDMAKWRTDGIIVEEAESRNGRPWRRAVFPETESRQFAATVRANSARSLSVDSLSPHEPSAASEAPSAYAVGNDPGGFVRMRVYGGNGRREFSALSVPLLNPAVFAARAEAVAGNRVRVPDGSWQLDDFAPGPTGRATHFLEVRDGLQAGRLVDLLGQDGNWLVLAEDVEELEILRPGDTYRVRPHWTLHSFFLSLPVTGKLHGAAEKSEADQVLVFDPTTQQFETFWYWTDGNATGWRDSDDMPANDLVVYPARGLVVSRPIPAVHDFIIVGEVRMTPLRAEVLPGFNVLPVPFPMEYRLNDTGLRESGLHGADFQDAADSIHAPLVGGGFELFWWSTAEEAEGYVDFNYRPAGDKVFLNGGQGFVLERRGAEGFWWTSPVPSFLIQ
jgi:hypothetical protein